MKIIVQGFDTQPKAYAALVDSGFAADEIIGAFGDDVAEATAEELGVPFNPRLRQEELGDYGYPMLNMEMTGLADALVSHGNDAHLIACCRKKGIPIHVAL